MGRGLVDSHGNWAPLAFPGRFCRWSRDEPTTEVLVVHTAGHPPLHSSAFTFFNLLLI
jgi:hypothetical protein